jgi:hypothetical protein
MAIDTTGVRSRRALLFGAAGGIAAIAAHAVGRPPPAAATHGDVHLGGTNQATTMTVISNIAESGSGLLVTGNGLEGGLGWGIQGSSNLGAGLDGRSGYGNGVIGRSSQATGVAGESFDGYGVHGHSNETYGVYGTSDSSYAVAGLSSTSAGVAGFSDGGHGVIGSTSSAVGVLGQGGTGRGGRFSGKKAQIKLDPSTAATHPSSGQAGDLFVDASKRLWFCKGGTSWVRIV